MDLYDKISELCKRRGFLFSSFEIYGGVGGFYDYGPLGSILKRRIEDKWRDLFVRREGMVELESTILMPAPVFEASGHVAHFTDVMTTCLSCGRTFRTDLLVSEAGISFPEGTTMKEFDRLVREHDIRCPDCGGNLSESEPFNLMFKVTIGPIGKGITAYGRPEAAQGQFTDFKRIYAAERERLPLAVAQIGRCVRNEIAPRKGPIRLREFTIIDYEIFVDPENMSYPRIKQIENWKLRILPASEQESGTNTIYEVTVREALERGLIKNEIHAYFLALAVKFLEELGVPPDKQRLREQLPNERAHYSKQTFDQEVWTERWGWIEVSGHAYRTDYDLSRHITYSGVDMRVFKPFEEPKEIEKIILKPKLDLIQADFKEDAPRILDLIKRAIPEIVERELREKGFYELPGPYSVRLKPEHVEFEKTKELAKGRLFVPHVIEPSFGVDRIFYVTLEYAYTEKNDRVIFRLPRDVAPIQVAVFPLVNKDGLPEKASTIYQQLIDEGFYVEYDESGSIGRRYARADEAGVPICITVDYQTLQDDTVTLRDRDTWAQVRAKIEDLPELLTKYLRKKLEFNQLGVAFKPAPSE
ncbi:MAG: glycine--tRNA ligase [Candidatus Bathyarchaeia archaeon]